MNEKLRRLIARRDDLLLKAAQQRRTLVTTAALWRQPLAQLDQGLAALRYVTKYSLWIASAFATLSALRPGLVGKWVGRAWIAARVIKNLRGR